MDAATGPRGSHRRSSYRTSRDYEFPPDDSFDVPAGPARPSFAGDPANDFQNQYILRCIPGSRNEGPASGELGSGSG